MTALAAPVAVGPGRGLVPLARRLQHGDRRRAALSVLGVTGGVLLVLATSALFAGFHAQETAYLDRSPASVVLSQRGVGTMQLSLSSVPDDAAQRAVAVEGVAWAEGIRHVTTTVSAPGQAQLVSYVFGFDAASGRGGPQELATGRLPGPGEVVVDRGGARQLGIGVGDHLDLFGRRLRVSGLSAGLTSLANTTVFVDLAEFRAIAGLGTSYVLVGADPSVTDEELAARLRVVMPDIQVQTRAAFIEREAALVREMYTGVIQAMRTIGAVVAYALIALSLSAATAANASSFAVLRALGASTGRLRRTVVAQALWIVGGALVLATASVLLLGRLTAAVAPNVLLLVTARDVVTTALVAGVVGAVASLGPIRRVLAVDIAGAFRAGS